MVDESQLPVLTEVVEDRAPADLGPNLIRRELIEALSGQAQDPEHLRQLLAPLVREACAAAGERVADAVRRILAHELERDVLRRLEQLLVPQSAADKDRPPDR